MKPVTNQVIRKAFGAGRWFPAGRNALGAMIDGCLLKANIPGVEGRIVSAIAPHAGYEYSGKVAGAAFSAIRTNLTGTNSPETVVILGASHRTPIDGAAIMDGDAIETPLGITGLDRSSSELLTNGRPRIRLNATPHEGEHAAENEIPFVQRTLPGARLVVVLIGDHSPDTLAQLVAGLNELAKTKRILVVASSDMLHSPDYELVSKTDRQTLKKVAALDAKAIAAGWSGEHQIFCGLLPVLAAIQFASSQGCKTGTILDYRNNGDDDPSSRGTWVVGYGAAAFATP